MRKYVGDKEVKRKHGDHVTCTAVCDGKGNKLGVDGGWCTLPPLKSSSKECLWQLARYAVAHYTHNMSVGRTKPVYMFNVASEKWTGAKLVPQGIVEIDSKGDLVDSSVESFMKEQKPCSRPFTKDDLLRMVEAARNMKVQSDCVKVNLPHGFHVVGELCVHDVVERWPVFPSSAENPFPIGTWNFVEVMLRILIGDRVQSWAAEHVDKLMQRYDESMKEERDRVWEMISLQSIENYVTPATRPKSRKLFK